MQSGGIVALQCIRALLDARRGGRVGFTGIPTILHRLDPSRFTEDTDSLLAPIVNNSGHLRELSYQAN